MAKIDIVQPSFAAGEITEALQSREDLAKQHVGLKTCRNALVTSTGSIINRPGTKYVSQLDASKTYRLIPFIFSTEQAYALPFGDKNFSIVKDGEITLIDIVDAGYKWTLSGSGTMEYYLELGGGGDPGLPEPPVVIEDGNNMVRDTVGSLFLAEWDYGDNDTLGYDTIYVRLRFNGDPDSEAQGYLQTPLLFVTPYSDSQIANLDYAQSADVMYLPSPDFTPYKITRASDTSWFISAIDIQDGPYRARDIGDEDITFTPAAKTGSSVLVEISESITWATVGLPVRLGSVNPGDTSIIEWGWGRIASIVDSNTIRIDIEKNLGYEYLLNPEFKDGIAFWEDRSDGNSTVTFDSGAIVANLNANGGGADAKLAQTVTVSPYERLTFEITVSTLGGGGSVKVKIGNSAETDDVLATVTINSPGSYSYTTLVEQPTGSTVYVTIQTDAGAPPYTHTILKASLMRLELATTNWRRGAWDATLGWPERITLFEQSVFYGKNTDQPDTAWKTKTGEYEGFPFNTPPLDTDSVSFTLASERVNAIQWLRAYGELAVGTTGSEWRVSHGANGETITPTSINAKAKSNTGSSPIRPIIIGDSLLFIRQGENANTGTRFCKVYEMGYSFDSDGYKPRDLTVLAPHLFKNHTIKEWAWQESPNATVWCIRDDGVLLGLTFIKEQEIFAWHRHDTLGAFESICVVPEDGEDAVYLIARRNKIESGVLVSKKYIERMIPRISNEAIYDYYSVDSGVTVDIENDIAAEETITDVQIIDTKAQIQYSGSISTFTDNDYIYISNIVGMTNLNKKTFRVSDVTSLGGGSVGFYLKDKEGDDYIDGSQFNPYVSGGEIRLGITEITKMSHLLGKTVSVLADGSALEKTVGVLDESPTTKYGFTLDRAAIVVHAGLPYTTEIETLPHDFVGSNGSTSQGKDKSLVKANIYFHKSRYAKVSSGDNSIEREINFSNISSGNNPPPLFTGVKEKKVDDSYTKITQTLITNDQPLPLEVVGIISNVDFNEK